MRNRLIVFCLSVLGALSAVAAEVAASSSASFSYVPSGGPLVRSESSAIAYYPSGAAVTDSSSGAFSFGEGKSAPHDIDLGDGLSARDMADGAFWITGAGELTSGKVAGLKGLGVTNLVIGTGVTGVGEGAFAGWKSLRDVTFGTDCTAVGANAFGKCYNLTNVTCAAKGVTIGDYAFLRCNSLLAISFADMPTYLEAPFAFHTVINMRDGLPDVSLVPQITVGGYEQVLLGKTNLTDDAWCEVKDMSTRAGCHFFKIELRAIQE